MAPRTPVEGLLASVWAQVLGVDRVGVEDNFFDLGGDSLRAMQATSKMSLALRRPFPVKALLEHPTIAAIARYLDERQPEADLPPAPSRPSTTASPAPQRRRPFLTLERRPLLSLLATGQLGPVDAAAICTTTELAPRFLGPDGEKLLEDLFEGVPIVSGLLRLPLGTIAVITLPRSGLTVYEDPGGLLELLTGALVMAGGLGARAATLTGLLASATGYGHDLAAAVAGRGLPAVSTGHATTAATVALTIERLSRDAGRELRRERLGLLGLGSIGIATLRLALRALPHPDELLLCDLQSKQDLLERARREAVAAGFGGTIRVLGSRQAVPEEFYEATLMIGATNLPGVLDVARLRPGTLLVDDSAPHCFDPGAAIQRLTSHNDILFTTAGLLRAPAPVDEIRYLPRSLEGIIDPCLLDRPDPHIIEGCVLSGLLSARVEALPATLGYVEPEVAHRHHDTLTGLGFTAAAPQCAGFVLPDQAIQGFRTRFGVPAGPPGPRAEASPAGEPATSPAPKGQGGTAEGATP